MDTQQTQQRLDKLAGIEQKNKLRFQKFMKKKKQQGYKQISCLVSSEIYNKICSIRDNSIKQNSPISVSDIITKAISDIDLQVFKTTFKDNVSINDIKQLSKSTLNLDTQFKADIQPIQEQPKDTGTDTRPKVDIISESITCTPEADNKPIQDSNSDIGVSMSSAIDSDSKANTSDILTISAGANKFDKQRCFKLILELKEQKFKQDEIADYLNKHGWKTEKNKNWNGGNVAKFLFDYRKDLKLLEVGNEQI